MKMLEQWARLKECAAFFDEAVDGEPECSYRLVGLTHGLELVGVDRHWGKSTVKTLL